MTFNAVAGSEFILEADLVLLAMGFTGHAIPQIVNELHLSVDGRGAIIRDASGKTSAKDVYITGDVASGPSLVVRAIADGIRVADQIARDLA
jgi:glutamate synthase (NADPH/NADH) small chain